MNAEEYIEWMERLVSEIKSRNAHANIVLIAAWGTDDYDPISAPCLSALEREKLMAEYRAALCEYAHSHGYLYVDPNPSIKRCIHSRYAGYYLNDHIHPNAGEGIRLYSRAVLVASGQP